MSNVARLHSLPVGVDAPASPVTLGPGEVVEASGPIFVTVRLASGETHEARLAMAFTYAPVPGDVALVLGNADGHYVIGVLSGQGKATLAIPGDVELRAVGGRLSLKGDRGVSIDGEEVEVRAGTLRMIAGTLAQKLQTLRQTVTDLWSVRAGEAHSVVDGTVLQQSKSATILTEENVTINGRSIHLG